MILTFVYVHMFIHTCSLKHENMDGPYQDLVDDGLLQGPPRRGLLLPATHATGNVRKGGQSLCKLNPDLMAPSLFRRRVTISI